MDDRSLLRAWLCQFSEATKKGYSSSITQWTSYLFLKTKQTSWKGAFLYLGEKGPLQFERLIAGRVLLLKKEKKAAQYINQLLSSLASFLNYSHKIGLINFVPPIPFVKGGEVKAITGPTLHEFTKVLDEAGLNKEPFEAIRDTFLLRLHFDLSLRISEVLSIRVDDIGRDSHGAYVSVLRKYHDKKQIVYFSVELANLLHRYTMERSRALKSRVTGVRVENVKDLFLSFSPKNHYKLKTNEWQRIVKRYGKEIGIDLTTNKIRHTSITVAMEAIQRQQMPLEAVIAHTGHKSLNTILRYRDRLHRYQLVIANNMSSALSSTYHNQAGRK